MLQGLNKNQLHTMHLQQKWYEFWTNICLETHAFGFRNMPTVKKQKAMQLQCRDYRSSARWSRCLRIPSQGSLSHCYVWILCRVYNARIARHQPPPQSSVWTHVFKFSLELQLCQLQPSVHWAPKQGSRPQGRLPASMVKQQRTGV